ncbi:MAG: hypothetical protein ACTSRA_10555 [Promethearchaeota archaeon]
MNGVFIELARVFYRPGLVGKNAKFENHEFKFHELITRFVTFLLIPSLALGWILLYALLGPDNFMLYIQMNSPISFLNFEMPIIATLIIIAAIVVFLFWFTSTIFFFVFNILIKANRKEKRLFINYLAAAMVSFSCHYVFITIALWLMVTRATFFWGMRTTEDTIFTISLLISLFFELLVKFFISKNYFQKGFITSILALFVYAAVFISIMIWLFS